MSRKILVTGSNGMLGGKLIKKLTEMDGFEIIAVAGSEDKVNAMIERESIRNREKIQFLSIQNLLDKNVKIADLYGAVHLAFSRRVRPASDIAGSIDFSAAVFEKLASVNVERVINVSSQGIYGDTAEIRTESTPPAPITSYTMAKYAAEKIFDFCFKDAADIKHTNLRLDLVVQSQNLIPALCSQAKNGKINLKGGEQRFSFIDADDAAAAIIAMLLSEGQWANVYNVGWNQRRYTLLEIADIVADTAVTLGYKRPEIVLDKQDISLWAGMDSTRFMEHTGWKPDIDIYKMVKNFYS